MSRIVGVEMSKQAVEDACENARLNGKIKIIHVVCVCCDCVQE